MKSPSTSAEWPPDHPDRVPVTPLEEVEEVEELAAKKPNSRYQGDKKGKEE